MSEQDKHLELRKKLLQLPKVKAKEDFLTKLQAKINLEDARVSSHAVHKQHVAESQAGFFGRVFTSFGNPWVASAASFAVVVLIVIGVYFIAFQSEVSYLDNSLTSEPETKTQESETSDEKTSGDITSEDGKMVSESDQIASNDGFKTRLTERKTFTAQEEFTSRGFTDSRHFSERVVSTESPVTYPTSRGLPPATSTESTKLTEDSSAESPKLSTMPSAIPSEPGNKDMKESSLKRDLRMQNVIDRSGLENLREKILDLEK